MPICRMPEAVEDVEPVEFVLDRRRRLQPEHQPDAAGGAEPSSMSAERAGSRSNPGAMGQVGQPHARGR